MTARNFFLTPGWISDVVNPPQLDDIYASLKESSVGRPVPLELVVHASTNPETETTILVVPTNIRAVFGEDYDVAEYSFEGWVVRSPFEPGAPALWVRCGLHKSVSKDTISEAYLLVLEPGTELGVAPPPEFN